MKKGLCILLSSVLLFVVLIPTAFATFSEDETLSRKRAYYPFINESLYRLYEARPQAQKAQIDKIFISSQGDYSTTDIIEAQRSNFAEGVYPVVAYIHLQDYSSDSEWGEWVFANFLSNDKSYEFGKFRKSIFTDSISRDVTIPYSSFINIEKGLDAGLKEKLGEGIFLYESRSGDRYLLDVDLNDYQSCGYSILNPTISETTIDVTASAEEPQEKKEEPTEQYTKDQEIIISGETDFNYFYTYKDVLNYKCFSLTKDGKRFYAAVREDLYDYYKNAFQNHSLTLKGKYQFTANDGAPVVSVSTLVEGTKETNLRSYLWTLNKGSAKNPNFKAYADLKGDGLILSVAKDGQSITIDSNPWGAAKGSQAYKLNNDLALIMIKELNTELGLPDWLYTEMVSTRALDGRQKETFDYVTVSWSYHPDSGINILYRKNT